MRQLWAFFSISLKEAFVYRARGLIWFLDDTLPVITAMLFFSAVFSEQSRVGQYTLASLLIYFLLTMSFNVLLESHPEFAIAQDINQGFLSMYLLRPLSYIRFYAATELAYKVVRLVYLVPFLVLAMKFLPGQAFRIELPWPSWLVFGAMLVGAFATFYLLKVLVGLMAFWFTEVSWFISIFELLTMFFSGLILPLDLMPQSFQKLAALLPFQYLIYAPARLLVAPASFRDQLTGFMIQLVWLVSLFFLVKFVWRRGVRYYSAFGG